MTYVPLWCKSNFSFLEGASHPAELVEEAYRLGLSAVALTDRDGVYGMVKAHLKAKELGMPLIVGSEISLEGDSSVVLLVQDRQGYAELCQLISKGRLRVAKGECQVRWPDLFEHSRGLLALWRDPGWAGLRLKNLKEVFGDRLYALVTRHQLAEEPDTERQIRRWAERLSIPIVAGTEVLYHTPERRPLQDVLTCIRHGVPLHSAGSRLKANAEYGLLPPDVMAARFGDQPAWLERTQEVAARCRFSMGDLRYVYPSEKLPDGTSTATWLQRLAFKGAQERYPEGVPPEVVTQLLKELRVIEELDYGGYFLTMWEIVQFCRDQGILCQGRGSAANSTVCYCLGITAVDPVRMGLLFERFLSKERAEPPDIDLDIEHHRREEVIQHVYHKYGRERAAMVAVVITYRPRSALRDVGKALGLAETELDRLAKLLGHYGDVEAEVLAEAGLDLQNATIQHLIRLSNAILGFPRHLSIHPGGFLLGHEPVHRLVPIENGAMPNRTVIQWDKDDVEALGLFKVDLLGLGALTHLHRCFDLLARHRGVKLSMATIPAEDPATYAMIQRADTVGVFQIESRAQMAMLPRLKPQNYYDLVIEISLVRPGPITGGMVHPYLKRRRGEEAVEYPHPLLIPVLQKTLGVPLFQEQVMRLAVVAADYTPGEADQLRRDMAAWKKTGQIERHRERLIERMQKKGIAKEFAERVFQQIQGFGDYGFPESHAASFALISYAGAYLKCHYPAEFTCGLLNAMPMGFYAPATLVEDARHHGLEIRPVDLMVSEWDCTLEPVGTSFAVRMGLRYVKSLGIRDWDKIHRARQEKPFQSLADVVRRTRLDEGALIALAEAGALSSWETSRRKALWRVRGLIRTPETPLDVQSEAVPPLAPLGLFETITWDYQRVSHSANGHPLAPLRAALTRKKLPDARTVAALENGTWVRYAGIVICRQRPGTASGVTFMTMEDETGFVNLVIWPQLYEQFRLLIKTESFLGVSGRLQVEQGVVHLVAKRFWKPELAKPATPGSRDFR